MSDSTFGYLISAAAALLLLMGLVNVLNNAANHCKMTDRLSPTAVRSAVPDAP